MLTERRLIVLCLDNKSRGPNSVSDLDRFRQKIRKSYLTLPQLVPKVDRRVCNKAELVPFIANIDSSNGIPVFEHRVALFLFCEREIKFREDF